MKNLLITLFFLFSGLYILGFGIYTIAYTHLEMSGLILVTIGTLTTTLSIVLIVDNHIEQEDEKFKQSYIDYKKRKSANV
jgi:hypothetical protein